MARLMGGDKLASGGVRATFGPVESISQDKWSAAFDDLDLNRFNGGSDGGSKTTVESNDQVKRHSRLSKAVKK